MHSRRIHRGVAAAACAIFLLVPFLRVASVSAQSRVGPDSATRLTYLGRAFLYGTFMGLAYAGVDQWQNDPPQWGNGWEGYGKRAASNLGEFYIQEGATEGLAAVMNRPVTYTRCKCRHVGDRLWWATEGAVTDVMPDGSRRFAVPRVAGAYIGSFAQAAWRPAGDNSRVTTALINGTTSLLFGAFINTYYEFRPHHKTATAAGETK